MQVTICGGGNAAHVLVGLLASQANLRVHVYLPYGDEARRWQAGIEQRGGIAVITPDGTRVGRPHRVSADPAAVVPGCDLVLLALPAFAHEVILRHIAPHLNAGAWVGALPARGGFDWCVEEILGGETGERRSRGWLSSPPPHLRGCAFFGLQTLPWACRVREYGQEVAVLGTKAEVEVAVYPAHRREEIATFLGDMLNVHLVPTDSFLALTLADVGQVIHPAVMYGLFRTWDARPLMQAPLFYQGMDEATADILQQVSDEVQHLRTALEGHFPDLDLSIVRPIGDWIRRVYRDSIADPSTLLSCFVTNRSYAGLRAPVRSAGGGLVPDFQARYLAEDVPYGLLVTRGIAELAGVATPVMDRVIAWAQERLRKEYLVDGRVRGRDLKASRAPQRYGVHTLRDLYAAVHT